MAQEARTESAERAERRGASRPEGLNPLTKAILGAAIEVHRHLGPGLMESVYEECLRYELSRLPIKFQRQVLLPVAYKGVRLDCGFRMDVAVENAVVLELNTVDRLLPVHTAQLLTCLKLSGHPVGLLLNFNEAVLRKGVKRLVNRYAEPRDERVSSAPSAPEPGASAEFDDSERSQGTQRLRVSAVNGQALAKEMA